MYLHIQFTFRYNVLGSHKFKMNDNSETPSTTWKDPEQKE